MGERIEEEGRVRGGGCGDTCRVRESLLTCFCRRALSPSALSSSFRLCFKALRAAIKSRCTSTPNSLDPLLKMHD